MDSIALYSSLSSFDHPNPTTNTLRKIHISLDQEYGLQLKEDIIKTLKYLDDEKKSLTKLFNTSVMLIHTMNNTSQDKLYAIQYRYEEVSIILKIQSIKRYSIEFNSKLNCSYLHSKVNNSNIQQKIIRPEHFERPSIQQLPINNKQIHQQANHNKHHNLIVKAHYNSPWDGSEFKFQMVSALHEKYKKKLIIDLFVCYRTMNMNINQVITSYLRLKKKRILQICFSLILADALSSRYILFASEIKLRKLLRCKYISPVVQKLYRNHQKHHVYLNINNKANLFRKHILQKYGLQLLIWNKSYMNLSNTFIIWSKKRSSQFRQLIALYSWISSFIKKNMLRKQLIQRYRKMMTTSTLASINKEYIDVNASNEDCFINDVRLLLKYHSLHNLNILRNVLLSRSERILDRNKQKLIVINNNKDSNNNNDLVVRISNLSEAIISQLQLCIQYKQQLPKLPFQLNQEQSLSTEMYDGKVDDNDQSNRDNNSSSSSSIYTNHLSVRGERGYLTGDRSFRSSYRASSRKEAYDNNYNKEPHTSIYNNNNNKNGANNSKLFNDALDCSFDQNHNTSFCGMIHYDSSDSDEEEGTRNRSVIKTERQMSSFRIIKFHWLIKMSRRFIRILCKQTKLHSQYVYCHNKISRKYVFRRFWRSWKMLYQKQLQSIYICEHIYTLKSLKRILHHWFLFSVARFYHRKDNISQLIRSNRVRYSYKSWKYLSNERRRCFLFHRKLCLLKVQRIVSAWKVVILTSIYHNKAVHRIRRKLLMPWFTTWQRKFHQRTLLKRVFTIRKDTLIWRYLQQPNTFTRLYSNFQAWESYTVKQSHVRRTQNVTHKALYFRAASLLARYFVAWCKYIEIRSGEKLYIRKQSKLVTKRFFTHWLQHIKQKKLLLYTIIVNFQYKRKQVVYKLWKVFTYQQNTYIPYKYHIKYQLHQVFHAWRTLKRLCILNKMHKSIWPRKILNKRFQVWKSLYQQKLRYRNGFEVLSKCYYQRKKRLSFMNWPGRIESIQARYLLQYFQQRRAHNKTRCKLVEQPIPFKYVEPTTITTSFIEKKRLTLLERALKYSYVDSMVDFDSLSYYEDLLKTLLSQWSSCSKRSIKIRDKGFKLRHLFDDHLIKRSLRHWIFHTPRTSYRCVVWLIKPAHRAHDQYCRLQEKQNITATLLNNKQI